MAGNLLDTYVIGFDRAIRETVETKGGKLRQYVQLATGDLFRKEGVYQRTSGGGLPQKVTNRFGDSPVSDIDYSRRRTTRIAYQDGQFMDWADVSKMGTDPRSAKLTAMKNKFLRQEDITLDQALLGGAAGGVNGETTQYLTNANNMIDDDGATGTNGSASTITEGFTYERFLGALTQFGNLSVDIEANAPVFKISWNQWRDMMSDEQFVNFDYTAKRPIDGSIGIYDYMGAKFCVSNILPYSSSKAVSLGTNATSNTGATINIADSNIDTATGTWSAVDGDGGTTGDQHYRAVYAFVQDAALLEINPDMTTKISERADKSFNYYAYMKAEFGAVRMEEEKVIVIPSKEGTTMTLGS
jgi:hypothetical protein